MHFQVAADILAGNVELLLNGTAKVTSHNDTKMITRSEALVTPV
jgi:hypothetical protein